jgi:hypothetical protein
MKPNNKQITQELQIVLQRSGWSLLGAISLKLILPLAE